MRPDSGRFATRSDSAASLTSPLLAQTSARPLSTARAMGHVQRALLFPTVVPAGAVDDEAGIGLHCCSGTSSFTEAGLESYSFSPYTLRFTEPAAERRFAGMLYRESLIPARIFIALCAVSLSAFQAADSLSFYWLSLLAGAGLLALTWHRGLSRRQRVQLSALPLAALLLFVYMEPRNHGTPTAMGEQARTVFVVWTSYLLCPLLMFHTFLLNLSILAAWLVTLWGTHDQSLGDDTSVFLAHLFSNFVGLHAGYYRERLARKSFAVAIYYDFLGGASYRSPEDTLAWAAQTFLVGSECEQEEAAAEDAAFWEAAHSKTRRLIDSFISKTTLQMPAPLEQAYRDDQTQRSRHYVVGRLWMLFAMVLVFVIQDLQVFSGSTLADILMARLLCGLVILFFGVWALTRPFTEMQFQMALSLPYLSVQLFYVYAASAVPAGDHVGHALYAIGALRAFMVVQASRMRLPYVVGFNLLFLGVYLFVRATVSGIIELHGYGPVLVLLTLLAGVAVAYLEERSRRAVYLQRYGYDRLRTMVDAHGPQDTGVRMTDSKDRVP